MKRTLALLFSLAALLCCLSAAFAQESKAVPKRPPAKPALSESFAKAGLRALIAIGDYDGEGDPIAGEAKKAYQEAQAERDPEKPAEEQMFAGLVVFNLLRTVNNMKKRGISDEAKEELTAQERECSSELETAFRHRISINLPASCTSKK